MSIITPSAFTGKYAITKSFNEGTSKIQEYIDHYEDIYMNQLFGAALYVLYTEGVASSDEVYTVLRDPFAFDSDVEPNTVVISEGVSAMLVNLIYAHYQREDLGVATSGGQTKMDQEAGSLANDNYTNSFAFYNQGIKTYKAIQQYIEENSEDYPDYNGVKQGYSWLI